jgi:UDP-2,3-diacylglucosamine pyrophosphatase LpxH
MERSYYPTVVLSDVHLGTSFSKTMEVVEFLRTIDCDRLILNGDIVDGWHLQRKSHKVWKKKHILFFRVIMKMMENFGTEVIYVRGNHDDFLDGLTPVCFSNLKIVRDYILERNGKRYYVTHGDIFDPISSNMRWLSKFGDAGYTLLLHINKYYNHYRALRGKPYYSFAQDVKLRFKSAVSYIADFEASLVALARVKRCDGVICGHIHHPENKFYGDVHYLNSGDWIDSLSALVEEESGGWTILYGRRLATDKALAEG